ncbi:MAG: type 1 glutamine amidotransferase [Paracoccaceae bacterium]
MRVAIVENTEVTHHGQVGVALHEAAARIEIFRPWKDGILPEFEAFDALVAFGGEQSAMADQSHPYLPRLAALMAETAQTGRAVLGICLGAQIMARGLGARNSLGNASEFGWCDVKLTGASKDDPVLRHLPQVFPIFQWHADTFTLPTGSVQLATSPVAAVQSYRSYRAAYGMQFHFEASIAMVSDWNATFPKLVEANEPGWLAAFPERAATLGVAADGYGLAIARAWVGLI